MSIQYFEHPLAAGITQAGSALGSALQTRGERAFKARQTALQRALSQKEKEEERGFRAGESALERASRLGLKEAEFGEKRALGEEERERQVRREHVSRLLDMVHHFQPGPDPAFRVREDRCREFGQFRGYPASTGTTPSRRFQASLHREPKAQSARHGRRSHFDRIHDSGRIGQFDRNRPNPRS